MKSDSLSCRYEDLLEKHIQATLLTCTSHLLMIEVVKIKEMTLISQMNPFNWVPLHSRRRDRVPKIWTDTKGSIQEFQKAKACSILWNMIEAACRAPGRIGHLACREVVGEGRGRKREREWARTVIWRQMEWDFPETVLSIAWTSINLPHSFTLPFFLNARPISLSSSLSLSQSLSLPPSHFSPSGYPVHALPSFAAEMTPCSWSFIRMFLASLRGWGTACVKPYVCP